MRRIATQQSAEHGRYIYAYCHVRTNQVVYSLSRTLNSTSSLAQLPDLGANHKPASLRKDHWKPLYTLCLPSSSTSNPHTLRQGLHAFKKLREYRKLHELSWTPSPLLAKPFSETAIQHLRDDLADRGGSKKESVYDVIKRKKRKMRVKAVMDQRANSVADLAAVLLEQQGLGEETLEEQEKERSLDRRNEVREMLALAEEADGGGLEELEQKIAGLEARLEKMQTEEQDAEGVSRTQVKRELYGATSRKLRMEFAANAVAEARATSRRSHVPSSLAEDGEEEHGRREREERAQAVGESAGADESSSADTSSPVAAIDYAALLPSFPSRSSGKIPKRGPLKQKLLRLSRPVFSTEGVTVKWSNILDAEFAEEWPESVKHERMGWSRYTAPRGDAEAVEDVGVFKEGLWRKRGKNWGVEEVGEEGESEEGIGGVGDRAEARREFVGEVKESILRRMRGRDAERRQALANA